MVCGYNNVQGKQEFYKNTDAITGLLKIDCYLAYY